jgi:hypothetical protein
MKLTQSSPTSSTGRLTMFYRANQTTSSFDNVAFLSRDDISFVQDAGDALHTQANALDSAFVLDTTANYANPANKPVRWLAEGRDPSATIDSATPTGNDGDNEITGLHVSDGDPSVGGILGAKNPQLFDGSSKWRWFYTQQHGDNFTWEVLSSSSGDDHGGHNDH